MLSPSLAVDCRPHAARSVGRSGTCKVTCRARTYRFRTMSFSGDTSTNGRVTKGFTSEEEYLQHVAPERDLPMFGYNESFAGPDGAADNRTKQKVGAPWSNVSSESGSRRRSTICTVQPDRLRKQGRSACCPKERK
jgi:hypothetical protein